MPPLPADRARCEVFREDSNQEGDTGEATEEPVLPILPMAELLTRGVGMISEVVVARRRGCPALRLRLLGSPARSSWMLMLAWLGSCPECWVEGVRELAWLLGPAGGPGAPGLAGSAGAVGSGAGPGAKGTKAERVTRGAVRVVGVVECTVRIDKRGGRAPGACKPSGRKKRLEE